MIVRFQPERITDQPIELPVSTLVVYDEYHQPLLIVNQTQAGVLVTKRGEAEFQKMAQQLGLETRRVVTSELIL